MFLIPLFFALYLRDFESWEFDKEATQNFEGKPTQSKTNFRSSLGITIGNKSLDMFGELDKGILQEYEFETKLLYHNKTHFHILNGSLENISTKPVVYIGSYPLGREIIYLDPINSPLLDHHFRLFVNSIPENSSAIQILCLLMHYIRNSIFSIEKCHEYAVASFIYDWTHSEKRTDDDFISTSKNFQLPFISIEEFINAKIGVCRQLALVTVYLLDRLTEANLISGKAYLSRDIIKSAQSHGGHAWALLIDSKENAWHIDPLWNVIHNLRHPDGFRALCGLYGTEAVERELKRLSFSFFP